MSTEKSGGGLKALSGLCILLIDSNPLVALDCQDALIDAGSSAVIVAHSIPEGLERIGAMKTVDAVIVDVNLGEQSGILNAQSMLATGIPMIIATSHPREHSLPEALDSVPFVSKPYLISDLIGALLKALQSRR